MERLYRNYSEKEICFQNNHPFQLIKNKDYQQLEKRLWQAQLRVAFPILENKRIEFIKRYEKELRDCLPVEQFNETINNPLELEFGTLYHLVQSKRLLVSREDYSKIIFFRNIRNKVSHIQTCTVKEMMNLLSEC